MHDKEAESRERIAWTHTRNMMTDDPDAAWRVMAYTAKVQDRLKEASGQRMTGRKTERPVLAYSLNWHPEQDPDKDHMLDTAMESLQVLGMQDHEALIVAHRDTPHRHVHVIANRIHPVTGLVATNAYSYRRLSEFAHTYQQKHGLDYCPQREENMRKKREGEKTGYRDPKIAEAWAKSDDGKSFAAALEAQGYRLAQGNKRLVVIDPYGKAHNPVRHIEGIRAKDFRERLQDFDTSTLPDATELARENALAHEQKKKEAAAEQTPDAKKNFEKVAKPEPGQPEAPAKDQKLPERGKAAEEFNKQTGKARALEPPKPTPPPPPSAEKPPPQEEKPRLRETFEAQMSRLSAAHKLREQQTREELAAYYRLEEQRREIRALEERTQKAAWWKKLFGLTRKDQQRLSEMQLSFADAQSRYREQLGAVRKDFDNAASALRKEHGIADPQKQQIATTRKKPKQNAADNRPKSSPSQALSDAATKHTPEQEAKRQKLADSIRAKQQARKEKRDRDGPSRSL